MDQDTKLGVLADGLRLKIDDPLWAVKVAALARVFKLALGGDLPGASPFCDKPTVACARYHGAKDDGKDPNWDYDAQSRVGVTATVSKLAWLRAKRDVALAEREFRAHEYRAIAVWYASKSQRERKWINSMLREFRGKKEKE